MDRDNFIKMLNQDLADEHASILRYLIHAYQVGEDTPLGQMLLSTAREEMWHMNWLGDEIGEMGEEPLMEKGDYPYDGTSNASLLRSYIEWEANLVKLYEDQAAQVEEEELKRILQQLGWESLTHLRRFQYWLEKLGPDGEEPLPEVEAELPADLLQRFHSEMDAQYKLVLQHLRHAFVFEEPNCPVGSELELTAMRHMKHMSHFAEELAESGEPLPFDYPGVDMSVDLLTALRSDLALTEQAKDRSIMYSQDPEVEKHHGLKIEVDTMVTRNGLLSTVVKELMASVSASDADEPEPSTPVAAEAIVAAEEDDDLEPKWTVGSLKS
jgi:bacterioferritin